MHKRELDTKKLDIDYMPGTKVRQPPCSAPAARHVPFARPGPALGPAGPDAAMGACGWQGQPGNSPID